MTDPAPPSADDLERLAGLWFCAAPALSPAQLSEIEAWQQENRTPSPLPATVPASAAR